MPSRAKLSEDLLIECQAAHRIFEKKKKELNLTQKKIADEAGISPASVHHYFIGRNALNIKFASLLSRVLQEPVSSFSPRLAREISALSASQHTASPDIKPYPIIETSDIGRLMKQNSYVTLPSTENAGKEGYWLTVSTTAMTSATMPSFPEGTPILIQPKNFVISSGKFYLAQNIITGDITFRRYVKESGAEYLLPLNQGYQTLLLDDRWKIIGRVIDAKILGL